MQEPNVEELLKGIIGEVHGVKDIKTTPTDRKITDELLYATAKCHIQGLLEQPELTTGQIAFLEVLVKLVGTHSTW